MVNDITFPTEFGVKWREWYLRPTIHAYYEIADLGFDLYDVLSILEMGYECSKGRRASGTIERCIKKGKKEYRVVVVESYSYDLKEEVWIIKHVGGK
ncbi:MAG: hypothetical protein QGH39_02380 [Candidatus Thermoplasmatota archaeon]|jgi:hypothetical protein|nr:hypothetical protein [Candidatus Thermoplasmatota archaeon]MDP7264387.1 hypothetical protein [Candidatus Thermoplasmatota archaeon]